MNYTSNVIDEIFENSFKSKNESLVFLNSIFRLIGKIEKDSKTDFYLSFETKSINILLFINENIISKLYDRKMVIEFLTKDKNIKNTQVKGILKNKNKNDIFLKNLLEDAKICKLNDFNQILDFYPFPELKKEEEIAAFFQALFLTSGYIYLSKENNKNGYSLEFYIQNESIVNTIKDLFIKYNLDIKQRNDLKNESIILYFKDAESINDFLAIIKSYNVALELSEIQINKSIRNDINRKNNCIFANINKSIQASERQINAINYLLKFKPNLMNDKLKFVADARLENPDCTIDELAKILNVSKSLVRHRLDKILELSKVNS